MDDCVISVKGVSKNFLLPHEKNNSIKSGIVNIFKKKDSGVEIQHALRDISFDIRKGEFFGIVGRNGSGKSTLLKMLAGIYQPTKGEIITHGKVVPFIELGVGFNPELTGRENVYLNGAMLGFSRKRIDEMYSDIVGFAELEKFMDQKLKNYSSGMQVRLAFSVATRAQADVLIVDEVLAVGDADFQRKCYEYFKRLKKDKDVTVVFVTHDMSAVREYCDKVILIEDGEIASRGNAESIADKYLQLFNGSDGFVDEKKEERWGTGEVRISEVKLKSTKEEIRFQFIITSDIDLEKVIIGYNFKNTDGMTIMGGNSMNAVERVGTEEILIGQSKRVSFSTPNFLGSGEYTLELAIKTDNGTILDKIINAGRVKITKVESYYPTIALAKMEISTIKGGKSIMRNRIGQIFDDRFKALESQLDRVEKQNEELLWASYFRDSIASSEWVKNKSFSAVNGAASYSFLYKLFKIYDVIKPKSILEFGLGQSTNLTKQYCMANSSVTAIVCDHDKKWVEAYESTINGINNLSLLLCETEDFRLADGAIGAKDTQCKDLKKKLSQGKYPQKFDLIIVDGPIGVDKEYSRTDILGLTNKLNKTFVVIIDDSDRVGEHNTINLLRADLDNKRVGFADWTVNGSKQLTIFASNDVADLLWAI